MRRLAAVEEARVGSSAAEPQSSLTAPGRAPNPVLLPIGLLASLGLGVALLYGLVSPGWIREIQLGAGASLCLIAGWIASAICSRTYWSRSMARQVAIWRRITDAFFAWVEDVQVSTEALNKLKVWLEEAVPSETV